MGQYNAEDLTDYPTIKIIDLERYLKKVESIDISGMTPEEVATEFVTIIDRRDIDFDIESEVIYSGNHIISLVDEESKQTLRELNKKIHNKIKGNFIYEEVESTPEREYGSTIVKYRNNKQSNNPEESNITYKEFELLIKQNLTREELSDYIIQSKIQKQQDADRYSEKEKKEIITIIEEKYAPVSDLIESFLYEINKETISYMFEEEKPIIIAMFFKYIKKAYRKDKRATKFLKFQENKILNRSISVQSEEEEELDGILYDIQEKQGIEFDVIKTRKSLITLMKDKDLYHFREAPISIDLTHGNDNLIKVEELEEAGVYLSRYNVKISEKKFFFNDKSKSTREEAFQKERKKIIDFFNKSRKNFVEEWEIQKDVCNKINSLRGGESLLRGLILYLESINDAAKISTFDKAIKKQFDEIYSTKNSGYNNPLYETKSLMKNLPEEKKKINIGFPNINISEIRAVEYEEYDEDELEIFNISEYEVLRKMETCNNKNQTTLPTNKITMSFSGISSIYEEDDEKRELTISKLKKPQNPVFDFNLSEKQTAIIAKKMNELPLASNLVLNFVLSAIRSDMPKADNSFRLNYDSSSKTKQKHLMDHSFYSIAYKDKFHYSKVGLPEVEWKNKEEGDLIVVLDSCASSFKLKKEKFPITKEVKVDLYRKSIKSGKTKIDFLKRRTFLLKDNPKIFKKELAKFINEFKNYYFTSGEIEDVYYLSNITDEIPEDIMDIKVIAYLKNKFKEAVSGNIYPLYISITSIYYTNTQSNKLNQTQISINTELNKKKIMGFYRPVISIHNSSPKTRINGYSIYNSKNITFSIKEFNGKNGDDRKKHDKVFNISTIKDNLTNVSKSLTAFSSYFEKEDSSFEKEGQNILYQENSFLKQRNPKNYLIKTGEINPGKGITIKTNLVSFHREIDEVLKWT
jgi:hypothetical protein